MRRFALYFLTSFVLFGFGSSLWFGYRALFTGQPEGAVLGTATQEQPFWKGATLVLAGEERTTLALWDEGGAPRVVPATEQIPVLLAKALPDGTRLLLVTDGGSGVQVFRTLGDAAGSAPLVAVTGSVSDIQFSPSGTYALFRLTRTNPANRESDVLDIATGTIRRVANDADGAMWDANGDGVLSWTSEGLLRLHTMSLNGTFQDPIEIRSVLVGNPILLQKGALAFIARNNDAYSVVTRDIVTKQERLITPISLPPDTTSAELIPALGGAHVLLRTLQKDVASSWVILDTANGATKPVMAAVESPVWQDASRFFFRGTDMLLHRYDISASMSQAFPSINAAVLP